MAMPRFDHSLLIGLSAQTKESLQVEAERQGKTMSALVRELVVSYLRKRTEEAR